MCKITPVKSKGTISTFDRHTGKNVRSANALVANIGIAFRFMNRDMPKKSYTMYENCN